MFRRSARALKYACLFLAVTVGVQAYRLIQEDDPLKGLQADSPELERLMASSRPKNPPAEKKGEDPGEKKSPEPGEEKESSRADASRPTPPLPAQYRVIEASGIFGKKPSRKKKSPPSLLGLLGSYAILRTPDGKVDLVAEGSELRGVKVLRISSNRALVEYEGKQLELTIFSGLGSKSLLPEGKEKGP